MTAPIPPRVLAAVDQTRATLRDLVESNRRHQATDGCTDPGICPGPGVVTVLAVTERTRLEMLLSFAIADLARRSYGQDSAPQVGEVIRVRNGDEDLYFVRAATADDHPDPAVCWLGLVPTGMAVPYSMLASDPDNPPVHLRETA